MDKEFVPYQEAIELKDLGFDELCMGGYDGDDNNLYIGYISNEGVQYNPQYYTKAPLYQQAFRWFRERYLLHHEIACGDNVFWFRYGKNGYISVLSIDTNNDSYWPTYEEAELACLRKLIEIVKKK
jgi:hypothetical protein